MRQRKKISKENLDIFNYVIVIGKLPFFDQYEF